MPQPVSATETMTLPSFSHAFIVTVSPGEEYFTALSMILMKT